MQKKITGGKQSGYYCAEPFSKLNLSFIMRVSLFVITGLLLSVQLLMAKEAVSQSLSERFITMEFRDIPLRSALNKIDQQSGFRLAFAPDQVDKYKSISLEKNTQSVATTLQLISASTQLNFKQDDNSTLNYSKEIKIDSKEALAQSYIAPVATIRGKITNENGEPLNGVSVFIKGEPLKGVISAAGGMYQLEMSDNDKVIVFSFIGMETLEIVVSKKTEVNVTMKIKVSLQEEIVVVGYGTQKKVNLTGAVQNIGIKDLATRPLTNASSALQGKVAGVYVMQNSGQPGRDNGNILIRGIGTFNDNSPLVLIDGIAGSINDVSPMDIESISVLKDAASSSIYGNRAANGVILITTRRGRKEKMHVEYTGYIANQKATYLPEVLSSYEHATLYEEAAKNSGKPSVFTADMIEKYRSGSDPLYPNTNWQDVWYNPATLKSHYLRLSGSSSNLAYSFSGGYLDQEGVLLGTGFKRFNFRSNIDAYFLKNNKLHFGINIAGVYSDIEESASGTTALIRGLNRNVPTAVVTWPDGSYGPDKNYAINNSGGFNNSKRKGMIGNFHTDYEIVKNLKIESNVSADFLQSLGKNFSPYIVQYSSIANYNNKRPTLTNSELTVGNDQTMATTLNAIIRYSPTFRKNHHFNILAGYSEETWQNDYSDGYRKYLLSSQPELKIGDVSTQTNSGGADQTALRSYFGRVNYDFKGKYLFEANVRRDGSSRFAQDLRYGTFPSASVGWRISEESFLKGNNMITDLKLRGSWGQLGNQNINSYYAASDILSTGSNYVYGGAFTPGVAVTTLTNKSVTWETATQTNIGLDVQLFKKLNITASYFQKTTDNILMEVPIPITLGALNTPFQNLGIMENTGWELTLEYKDKLGTDFNYDATINLSHIKNNVADLGGLGPIYGSYSILTEGQPFFAFYGYEAIGIFQSAQEISASPKQSENPQPGDIKFRDLNGDGKISLDKDRKVIGSLVPDLLYSMQLNFAFKGFDLKTFFMGVQGISAYSSLELVSPFFNGASGAKWLLDRWTPQNPSTTTQRVFLDGVRGGIASSYYLENASYLRLKNIELGYTLSEKLLSKIGIDGLRIFANVQNAFTITKYKGFDPEKYPGNTRSDAHTQVRIASFGLSVRL